MKLKLQNCILTDTICLDKQINNLFVNHTDQYQIKVCAHELKSVNNRLRNALIELNKVQLHGQSLLVNAKDLLICFEL